LKQNSLNCVFLGLSITSAWGNGHATTYRGLLKELWRRGHRITFLERDMPWYASNREFAEVPYCTVSLYGSVEELKSRFASLVQSADIVVVGSYVPDGIEVGEWVTSTAKGIAALYDIDTPVTVTNLLSGKCEYLSLDLCRKYHLYFSFTGGPMLGLIEKKLGSPRARPLYCSVDPSLYYPERQDIQWDVAYLGTYAADRQPALEELLFTVARQNQEKHFAVAGPQYPPQINWPANVERIEHLPAAEHRAFYNSQKFTLNVTRQDMIRVGYSPSVRLFEAGACGAPIITDEWPGLDEFYHLHSEILPVRTGADLLACLQMSSDQRLAIAERARKRTLRFHTAAVRAEQFEAEVTESLERLHKSNKRKRTAVQKTPTAALI
jgi:spore maturation protein CgeB